MLKHKLQWLALLAALLGVSQGAWAWGWAARCTENQSSENPTYYVGDEAKFWWCLDGTANGADFKRAFIQTDQTSTDNPLESFYWSEDGCTTGGSYDSNNKTWFASATVTSDGTWYYGVFIGWGSMSNGRYYNGNSSWNEGSLSLSGSSFTVNALPNPTSQSSSASGTTATVTWTRNSTYTTVMVVRYTGASPSVTTPTGGTSYSSDSTIGDGTVVYKGTSTTGYSDTGLIAGTTYTYYLYTVNNDYYSSGVYTSVEIPVGCTSPSAGSVSASAASNALTLDASSKTTTLSATGNGDTYLWEITSNPNTGASLSSTVAATPTATFTKPGTYSFRVGKKCSSDASYVYSNSINVTVSARDMYIKHNWGGVLDPWTWQKMTWNQSLMAWTYSGSYSGTSCGSCPGCNINTSGSDGGSWYDGNTVTVVNSPSQGDECIYKFTPKSSDYSATDGGAVVITGSVKYTITGAVNTANGGSVSPTSSSKAEGETVSFTATPSTGYEVEKWMVGDSKVADNVTSYTYTVGAADATVTVYFKCKTPTISYNMTGGGLYCSDAKAIGISGSQNGYKYKLYRTASPDVLVETQTGGGSTVAFTAQSTAGTYYVKVMPGTGCSETAITGNPTSVTITAGTHPDKDYFSVSDNDLTYNGTAQQATVESYNTDVYNPASITVKYGSSSGTSDKTDADDYGIYVTAASAVGNFCAVTSAIELDDDLTIAPVTPTAENKATLFTITGVPTTVTYDEDPHAASVAWKSPYSCTGTRTIYYKKESDDATTDAPEGAGTYAVTLRVAAGTNNAASESDISLGNIVINKASQDDVNITNAGTYCSNASVTAIATGGSGTGAYTFAKSSGDSGLSINSTTGVITVSNPGSITVTATRAADDNYNVSAASAGATFTFMAAPTAYTLSASGESEAYICSAGGTLTLSGSQSGYSYQLKKDGSNYGDAKAGTGSALVFTVYESGDYTCEAYLTGSPDCKTSMTGTVTLHLSLTPALLPATPTVKNYEPVTITSINTDIETWTISNAGNTAYLYNITSNSATVKASKANSPYTVTATTPGGCSSTVTVTVGDYTETCAP